MFTKQDNKPGFIFIPNIGIRLRYANLDISLGMQYQEILQALGKPIHQETHIYELLDDSKIKSQKLIYQVTDGIMILSLFDDILCLIEIPAEEKLFYDDIDLAKHNYETTLKELKNIKLSLINTADDTQRYDSINLALYTPGNELEVVDIYEDNYFEKIKHIISNLK